MLPAFGFTNNFMTGKTDSNSVSTWTFPIPLVQVALGMTPFAGSIPPIAEWTGSPLLCRQATGDPRVWLVPVSVMKEFTILWLWNSIFNKIPPTMTPTIDTFQS